MGRTIRLCIVPMDFGLISTLLSIPIGVEAEIVLRRNQRPQFRLTEPAVV